MVYLSASMCLPSAQLWDQSSASQKNKNKQSISKCSEDKMIQCKMLKI
jgi:hypothetical protein